MKKIYSTSIVLMLALVLIATSNPSLGLAKEKDRDRNDDNKDRTERESKKDDSSDSNYWLKDVRNWLSIANAQTSDDDDNDDIDDDANEEEDEIKNRMPVISSIKAPTVLSVNQIGTWTIKAFDPENEALEYSVDWGDVQAVANRMSAAVLTQTSTFTHAYTTPGTYTIKFTVKDESENVTESTVTVHVKSDVSQAPIISEISATSTSKHQGVVRWNTDIKSNSMVWVSKTSPVNTTGKPTIIKSDKVLSHRVKIGDLDEGTTYYVVVGSRTSASGQITLSRESSFTTKSSVARNKPPMISDLAGPQNLLTDQIGTWTIKAFDPENEALEYSVDWGDVQAVANRMSAAVLTQTSTFTHAYTTPGTYTIKFTVKDGHNLQYSTTTSVIVTATPDTNPPVITGINQTTSSSSTTIAWVTNEDSTSRVFYSTISPLDTGASTTMTIASDLLTKSHLLEINNLATSTVYYFKIRSVDASGNSTTSDEFTATTTSGL